MLTEERETMGKFLLFSETKQFQLIHNYVKRRVLIRRESPKYPILCKVGAKNGLKSGNNDEIEYILEHYKMHQPLGIY